MQVSSDGSKISTPSSIALMISFFPALKASSREVVHSNLTLGLRNFLKGWRNERSCPYPATWLTSPNHDLMLVMFWGVGNRRMASMYFARGATLDSVILNPANSTSFAQN